MLFKPWKLFGLVGGAVGLYLCTAVWLFSLIVFITIVQLPFGQAQAWEWYLGRPMPVGVIGEPGEIPEGLDPCALAEWFGGHVTQGFNPDLHNGIDIGLERGTPVRSTWEGTVTYAGWSNAGYGNLVIVQNGDWTMYYAHLSAFSVSAGQEIQTGTVLGLSGSTGWSTGPHLHYEVRHQGAPLNPATAPNCTP